jgi:hypothetical protein
MRNDAQEVVRRGRKEYEQELASNLKQFLADSRHGEEAGGTAAQAVVTAVDMAKGWDERMKVNANDPCGVSEPIYRIFPASRAKLLREDELQAALASTADDGLHSRGKDMFLEYKDLMSPSDKHVEAFERRFAMFGPDLKNRRIAPPEKEKCGRSRVRRNTPSVFLLQDLCEAKNITMRTIAIQERFRGSP